MVVKKKEFKINQREFFNLLRHLDKKGFKMSLEAGLNCIPDKDWKRAKFIIGMEQKDFDDLQFNDGGKNDSDWEEERIRRTFTRIRDSFKHFERIEKDGGLKIAISGFPNKDRKKTFVCIDFPEEINYNDCPTCNDAVACEDSMPGMRQKEWDQFKAYVDECFATNCKNIGGERNGL